MAALAGLLMRLLVEYTRSGGLFLYRNQTSYRTHFRRFLRIFA
jgi:hypothetical protein